MGLNPNKVDAINFGVYNLTFKDGTKFRFNWPNVKIHGILGKEAHYFFVDTFKVEDLTNQFTATANFIRTKSQGMMSGWFGSKKKIQIPNQVILKVTKQNPESEEIVLAEGK